MNKLTWDNANIVESYPGVCTPLTFSFARYVYKEVYMQSASLFDIDPQLVSRLNRQYETMLGYIDGRFYYNLETWCLLISYMPGFSSNPQLLQEMMGVRPEDRITITKVDVNTASKIRLLIKLMYYHLKLGSLTD